MRKEQVGDLSLVEELAATNIDQRLFSPSGPSICYCGRVVIDRFLCSECSESMSRALHLALADRLDLEITG